MDQVDLLNIHKSMTEVMDANDSVKEVIVLYTVMTGEFPPSNIVCKFPDVIEEIKCDFDEAVKSLNLIRDGILTLVVNGIVDRLSQLIPADACKNLRTKLEGPISLKNLYNEIIPMLEMFTNNKYPRLKR